MREEEILKKHEELKFDKSKYPNGYPYITEAMREYAREMSIGFANWASENYWVRDPFPNKHTDLIMWSNSINRQPDKTDKQLYNLYLEHLKTLNK